MKGIVLVPIKFYRSWISPALPGACRFFPTCSTYAERAIETHGSWKGVLLTAGRLLRCHPFHPGGYDPVPGKNAPECRGLGVTESDPEPLEQI